MVGANHPALVFQHPARGVFFQELSRKVVFKAGLGKLRRERAAKRRTAMVRQPFQIDTLRVLLHQQGFAVSGAAANKHHRLLRLLDVT